MNKIHRNETPIKTNKLVPFFYGLAELGPASIDIFIKVYLLVYFDLVMGLSPTKASMAIGLSVFWDALIDPLIGRFSDSYYSRNGDRKKILYFASFLMTISFIAIWILPKGSDAFLFLSLMCISAILNSSLALFSIPYIAVANDIEPSNESRKVWIGWRVAFLNLGSIFGLSVAAFFMTEKTSSSTADNYLYPVFILASVTLFLALVSIFYIYKKKSQIKLNLQTQKSLSLKKIFSDSLFKKLLASFFVVYCGMGLNSTLALYYYREYLNLIEKDIQIILVSFLIIFTLSLPIWLMLSKYISQKKLIITGGMVLGLSTMFIFPNLKGQSFWTVFMSASVLGGLFVGVAVILETYLSDYLNRKESELKQNVSGQYLGLWKMAQKISRAVAVGISGPILQIADHNPQTLANFFGYGVGSLFLISALIMMIPISEE
jgi:glycoside/pentoside/hexuronide:cation symporter, GPH family